MLKSTHRSTISLLGPSGFNAIGLDLCLDARLEQLFPDPSFIPPFHEWERLTPDEARERASGNTSQIRTGRAHPTCQVYLERRKELSNLNEDAFRTVRRIPPPKGKQHARLGNTYEFFRSLEAFTTFWDDPTQHPDLPPSPEIGPGESGDASAQPLTDKEKELEDRNRVTRTASGDTMPPEYRQGVLNAFIKLIAYEFGCNVAMARTEPRLHLSSPEGHPSPRKSYWASACSFIFQSPTTREAARAGRVTGPVAAATARPITDFTTPSVEAAQSLDLAREVIAALITAQHRSREGREEVRFGDGQWWTTKHRWGGGPGGPIGKEIERDAAAQAQKEAKDAEAAANGADAAPKQPAAKKPRKNLSMYDNYRMVRPPAFTWDKKAEYEAVGKIRGADYDDIFVISSVFHHVSILRIRVPARLLEVLEGSPEPQPGAGRRSWGKVPAWRSPWYDFFQTEERIEALKLLWTMMSWQMRKEEGGGGGEDANDVEMKNA